MEFSQPEYWSGYPFSSARDLPNPGIKPRSPTLWVDSLPAEPQRKPKNTGVGGLSLFQQIFLTQESNRGLLHCRWILYQLNYQESRIYSNSSSPFSFSQSFCIFHFLHSDEVCIIELWTPKGRKDLGVNKSNLSVTMGYVPKLLT